MAPASVSCATTDPSIRNTRVVTTTVQVLGSDGTPLANQELTVAQQTHDLLFGTTGFALAKLANGEVTGAEQARAEKLGAKLLGLCNFATLPFYWGRFEPNRGKPDTQRIANTARWLSDRGCRTKGHPLCWHTVTAPWLLEMSNTEILAAQLERIRRDVTAFAGLIDMWDVVNEAVIMPVFDKYDNGITRIARAFGRIAVIRETFAAARAANPAATLLLNDFDTSTAYECLLEGCLEADIRIDVLGIQSHMHQGYWGLEKTLNVLDRFARYNLPIHFSEANLVSGSLMPAEIADLNDHVVSEWPTTPEGEERQAREAAEFYTTLVAHPSVEAVTWWDFVDGGWLKAPAGLLRTDLSSKPVYDALHDLIKGQWWLPPTTAATDENGRIQVSGFAGQYTATRDTRASSFRVCESDPTVQIIL